MNNVKNYKFPSLDKSNSLNRFQRNNLELIQDVKIDLNMNLGKACLPISEIQRFSPGYLIPLKKDSTDILVDIYAGDKFLGKGEVVLYDDEVFIRVVDLKP